MTKQEIIARIDKISKEIDTNNAHVQQYTKELKDAKEEERILNQASGFKKTFSRKLKGKIKSSQYEQRELQEDIDEATVSTANLRTERAKLTNELVAMNKKETEVKKKQVKTTSAPKETVKPLKETKPATTTAKPKSAKAPVKKATTSKTSTKK